MTPTSAGLRTRKELKSRKGYDRKLIRFLFDLDWKYSIDTNGALAAYGSKAGSFAVWKNSFNSIP